MEKAEQIARIRFATTSRSLPQDVVESCLCTDAVRRRCTGAAAALPAGANRVVVLDTDAQILRVANNLSDVNERPCGRYGPLHCYSIRRIRTGSCDAAGRKGSLALRFRDSRRDGLPLRIGEAAKNDGQRSFQPEEDYADYDECDEGFDEDEAIGGLLGLIPHAATVQRTASTDDG